MTNNKPMNEGKTIIISNRLPVKVELDGDNIRYHKSEGGLATGLSSVYQEAESLWIGWPGIPVKNIQLHHRITHDLQAERMIAVMLSEQEILDFYDGFSNETLWPLFHYFPGYATFDNEQWETYVAVNRKFADAIVAVAAPGDRIWIHDYHLLLVPSMVRSSIPGASIGFFQHIPFPNLEIFRLLPWRNELLQGLLGADLIGFHTHKDVDHFMEAIDYFTDASVAETSVLSNEILVDDRAVTVSAFPMGIDFEKHKHLSCQPATGKVVKKIRDRVGDRKLMISVDRLDYSKGMLQRLKAYDLFLTKYPEFQEQVTFIQLIVPSRDTVSQYAALKDEIDRMVTDINTRYSSFDWEPVCYWYRSLSPEALSGLYTAADIALVTPLRDGMNLVSKEYVASKTNTPGVLILSEMAGAARELEQALIINPNDEHAFADAMYKGLTMPVKERLKRMRAMQHTVSHNTVHNWADGFLQALEEIKSAQHILDIHLYNNEIEEHILEQFISGPDAAFLLEHMKEQLYLWQGSEAGTG